ncbi:response regulator transcription factor [Actinospica sp. MGRD01-02]|uniref:Response regulator transcription factor n=1 Tax=Actinospica acidithermotolerans TaxID=2828514 RepID=A0A941EAY8_9ACTN|nr:response regulator transcription factor [Actinospica acidithermotolerans]MBR7829460.1 response regulator transcription factor [Actinospica acidithermotolerans]
MADESIRVLVVDDQAAVREGLATLLDLTPGIEVVGTARDGAQAVELVAEHRPAVVLMDLHMPGVDGIQATEQITREHPGVRVVVLTTYADDASIQGALRAGALGYLTKDADRVQIARAVQAAAGGQSVLDEAVQRRLIAAIGSTGAASAEPTQTTPPASSAPPAGLTAREVDVLRLIAAGRSNPEIAKELFVSEATVKTHINHVFAKTGARDRAQAVRFAYEHGLVADV